MARRKAKTKRSVPTSSSSGPALALSSFHEQLAALNADRAWLLKQIRRKRTELDNFINEMRSLITEMFERSAEPRAKLEALDEEIHSLFTELFTTRKFGKQSLTKIQRLYRSLQWQGVLSERAIPGQGDDDADPFGNPFADFEGMFDDDDDSQGFDPSGAETGARSPSARDAAPENQREMRQTFLRLAAKYHPDRATDQDTHSQNTEIMKEINRAYQDGDFARLLELEQQSFEDTVTAVEQGDDVERTCEKLRQENQNLRNQYEGIKAELRHLRNHTHEGEMVTVYRQAKRQHIDMFEQMIEEAEAEIDGLTIVRDFVRDFRDRKITIKRFLQGPRAADGPLTPEMMAQLMEEQLGIIIDPSQFY
ncbi:J domain-containing protein [Spirulina major]|uniref:J domain-containing protein n=1 Tax=Spirulina major TaxID=270636 RepID=UPI000934ADF9|nr:J domain-containing protein [Spirulina major]